MIKLKITLILIIICNVCSFVRAQEGFGTSNPNKDAVIELNAVNKGLLIPRIALTAINVAAPLQNHVAGMVVYNSATAGTGINQVFPGYYFNSGSKWVKILLSTDKAWNNVATNLPANSNTQDIYQMGKVGIGTTNPTSTLHIVGDGTNDPLVIKNLLPISSTNGNKMMMINNTTGVVTYTDIPPPDSYVLQATSGSQNFNANSFSNNSSVSSATAITFAPEDEILSSNFATLSSSIVTINIPGDYDLTASCNLLMPSPSANATYLGATPLSNSFMNVTVEIQKRASATGAWSTIASITNVINYNSFGQVSTLKPAVTLQTLAKDNQLRLIIYRGAGIYKSGGSDLPGTGSLGSGVVQNKIFKITKYN